MKENRLIIIGLNQIGKELVHSLSGEFEITCIEFDKSLIEAEKKNDVLKRINFIHGDATSRLTLKNADIENSSALIIAITTEKINLEIVRILHRYFNVSRIISVGVTANGCRTMESMNVEVENIFSASANSMRNRILKTTKTAHGIGLGLREILEVELHPQSRLANKILGNIAPINWNIGIIYRNGNIVVPRGDMILKPRDKIVILGKPDVLKTVSEIMSFNFIHFPHQYGSSTVVYLEGDEEDLFFEEVNYLFRIFNLKHLLMLLSKKAAKHQIEIQEQLKKKLSISYELKTNISEVLDAIEIAISELHRQCGMVILSKQFLKDSISIMNKKKLLSRLIAIAKCPVFIASSSFPYKKIAVPVIKDINIQHLLEGGLEISLSLKNEITTILVKPSQYIATDEELEQFKAMKKIVSDMSLIYKKKIYTMVTQGNPIKEIIKHLNDFQLLLLESSNLGRSGFISSMLNPEVSWHVLKRSNISTLILPLIEESL